MDNELSFYKYYHQNPINKWIHFFCIPMIVLSIILFLDDFYIVCEKIFFYRKKKISYKFKLINFIIIYYTYSYFKIGFFIGVLMMVYFTSLISLANFMIINIPKHNLHIITRLLFFGGWILQFIGHIIEGRKPALLDSIVQSFFQAPLFSFEVLLPQLFKK